MKRVELPKGNLSPQQFDAVMAQFASTQVPAETATQVSRPTSAKKKFAQTLHNWTGLRS